jgi:hypothetical protein
MPNLVTAAASGMKSKLRQGPASTPARVPYSSTTRLAMLAWRDDSRGDFNIDVATEPDCSN